MTIASQTSGGVPGPGHNDPFQKLKDTFRTLGETVGKAADARVKFLIATADAAYQQQVDLKPSKHGTDRDDAAVLLEEYRAGRTKATVFDVRDPNISKEISCARAMIKFGSMTKFGPGQPVGTMNDFLTGYSRSRKNPSDAARMVDASNALLSFARAHQRRDTLMTEAEMQEFFFEKPKQSKTSLQYLQTQRKNLQNLFEGKAANGAACDNDPLIEQSIKLLDKRIKAIIGASKAPATPAPTAATPPVADPAAAALTALAAFCQK